MFASILVPDPLIHSFTPIVNEVCLCIFATRAVSESSLCLHTSYNHHVIKCDLYYSCVCSSLILAGILCPRLPGGIHMSHFVFAASDTMHRTLSPFAPLRSILNIYLSILLPSYYSFVGFPTAQGKGNCKVTPFGHQGRNCLWTRQKEMK